MAMHELASIDTLYDESLLKIVSINVFDKDTAKMSQVVRNLNLNQHFSRIIGKQKIILHIFLFCALELW
jgi:hypothetical protein